MTKEIPLTQGYVALVDDEDFDRINSYKWYYDNGYALRGEKPIKGKRRTIYMHRDVLRAPAGMKVDHKKVSNTLDNRKENIRLANQMQNGQNRDLPKNNTSGFKGVSWDKSRNKWMASIRIFGHDIYLGRHRSAEDAARAYDLAARKNFGEFAHTNLPEVVEEDDL